MKRTWAGGEMTPAPPADWKITDVVVAGVSMNDAGAATITLSWAARGPDDKPAGFGELTLRRLDGWDIETENMGADFARKVLAYIVDNGKLIE